MFFLNVTHQVSLIIIHTVALQELSLCAHFLTDTHCWHFRESTALFLSDSGLFPHLTFMLHLIGWRRSGTLTPDCFAYLPSVPLVSFNEGLSPWGGWKKVCGPFEEKTDLNTEFMAFSLGIKRPLTCCLGYLHTLCSGELSLWSRHPKNLSPSSLTTLH